MSRYKGKPFLRLLDCYILKAIGHLDPAHEAGLRKLEPLVIRTFGSGETWDKIVAAEMEFSDTFPDQIRHVWDRYVAVARHNNVVPDSDEFVVEFVKRYFPGGAAVSSPALLKNSDGLGLRRGVVA